MKNPKTRKAVVKDGKIVLDVPKLDDGTVVELDITTQQNNGKVKKVINNNNKNNKNLSAQIVKKNQPKISTAEPNNKSTSDGLKPALSFDDMGLIDELREGVIDMGFKSPTKIQAQAIPAILDGKDILGSAQTGSGKTGAFAIPTIQILYQEKHKSKFPRALVLAPTRELARQISQAIADYGFYARLNLVTIYGGVSQKPQVNKLRKGVDVIVATPGRLIDLINQGEVKLEKINMFILDEADRMLDMGFINDIKRITKHTPSNKQVLLFSATLPKEITKLAAEIQNQPVTISVDPPATTVDTVESYVYFVEKKLKKELLYHLLEEKNIRKGLIFMRTKHSCNKLVKKLSQQGYTATAFHGSKSQSKREKTLNAFKNGDIDLLVATDVASRGIDVDDISHVINYDMSNEAEVYVHRVGRTARAGRTGYAYNFVSKSERSYLVDVERLTQEHLIRAEDYPFQSNPLPSMTNLKGKSNSNNHNNNRSKSKKKRGKKKRYRKSYKKSR